MNKDIRVAVDFFDHPKTVKLKKKLGLKGVISLIKLWCFAAKYRPEGTFSKMDEESICIGASWSGEPHRFLDTLVDIGFLGITQDDCFYIHEWEEHNGWASKAAIRSDNARKAAQSKWNKRAVEVDDDEKIQFRDFVFLTKEEDESLRKEHGEKYVPLMYDKLNAYKGQSVENQNRYSSDYHAIKNWVVKEVLKEQNRESKKNKCKKVSIQMCRDAQPYDEGESFGSC